MDLHLDGKVALITGASRGLGRATALALAREGADVVIAARNEGPLIEVADAVRELGQRALTVTADAGRPEDRERLVSQALDSFGHVDVLVSNATSLDLYGTDAPDMAFWNVPVARGSTVEITQLRRGLSLLPRSWWAQAEAAAPRAATTSARGAIRRPAATSRSRTRLAKRTAFSLSPWSRMLSHLIGRSTPSTEVTKPSTTMRRTRPSIMSSLSSTAPGSLLGTSVPSDR